MFCKKCGNPVKENTKFCPYCGHHVAVDNYDYNNKKIAGLFICICGLVLIAIGLVLYNKQNSNYYFSEVNRTPEEEPKTEEEETTQTKGKYQTSIIYDHQYSGMEIETEEDAVTLIQKDSTDQKNACPKEMKAIEDRIIKNYGIYAINLCELDLDFAEEIEKVIDKIYNEYPEARGYITNLTLVNTTMQEDYIAAFMPYMNFASSNTTDGYPNVIKTQVLLNTRYFLNETRLESSVKSSSAQGWFPKNATKSSPVAHEFGHYLSFIAMMNSHGLDSILLEDASNEDTIMDILVDFSNNTFSLTMIEEAYNNYKKDHPDYQGTLDEFRGSISQYALAKDNNGEYIYDETIAEAFHDCYLNGENAVDASKYIEEVLKKYVSKVGE